MKPAAQLVCYVAECSLGLRYGVVTVLWDGARESERLRVAVPVDGSGPDAESIAMAVARRVFYERYPELRGGVAS